LSPIPFAFSFADCRAINSPRVRVDGNTTVGRSRRRSHGSATADARPRALQLDAGGLAEIPLSHRQRILLEQTDRHLGSRQGFCLGQPIEVVFSASARMRVFIRAS